MKFKLHPIDRDIIRSISTAKLGVTPSKIAKAINVHATTVQKHVNILSKRGFIDCNKKGNRTYCKINLNKIRKGLF